MSISVSPPTSFQDLQYIKFVGTTTTSEFIHPPEIETSTPSIQSVSTPPLDPVSKPLLIDNTVSLLDLDVQPGDHVELDVPFSTELLGDLAGLEFQDSNFHRSNSEVTLVEIPEKPIEVDTSEVHDGTGDTERPEEAILFQGRRRKPTEVTFQGHRKIIDAESADRAFRMFSFGIK